MQAASTHVCSRCCYANFNNLATSTGVVLIPVCREWLEDSPGLFSLLFGAVVKVAGTDSSCQSPPAVGWQVHAKHVAQ
jgi:hypothetical protein